MKFSIIIPTYKRVSFLKQALESIEEQTYKNYEVVVVNECIEDKNEIDVLCSSFPKVKAIHHATPQGGNAARNTGIGNCDGELIAFLDDDDLWLPGKLNEHLSAHLQNAEVGLVYSNCELFWGQNSELNTQSVINLPADVPGEMRKGNFCPITTSAVTVTREAINACGFFDVTLVSFQDWDMWFRIAQKFQFSYIPASLVKFRQHYGLRTSKSIDKRFKGLDQIMQKWAAVLSEKEFKKKFLRRTNYFYADDLIQTNEKGKALVYTFKLLSPSIISVASVRNFVKLVFKLISVNKKATAVSSN